MKLTLSATIPAICLLAAPAGAAQAHNLVRRPSPAAPLTEERPIVDLALCLDVSGSMSGLVDAAKTKLWAIVNDLALAQPTPRLRVALVTINDGPQEDGFIVLQAPFTEDLDLISQHLFSLQIKGSGNEYVGRALRTSLDRLEWTPGSEHLKLIVVAGNESADQDQEAPFREECRRAIAQGILVNAIYCGADGDAVAAGWQEIARLADGQFAAVDHDNGTVRIATPFDERLAELGSALNATYVPFGRAGEAGVANQTLQDRNAESVSKETAASRAWTKANGMYRCAWDLLDACREGRVKLADVPEEDLPEEMQPMSAAERLEFLESKEAERKRIQEEIGALHGKRQAFLDAEMKKLGESEEQAFDHAVRRAVREQAASKGFRYE